MVEVKVFDFTYYVVGAILDRFFNGYFSIYSIQFKFIKKRVCEINFETMLDLLSVTATLLLDVIVIIVVSSHVGFRHCRHATEKSFAVEINISLYART